MWSYKIVVDKNRVRVFDDMGDRGPDVILTRALAEEMGFRELQEVRMSAQGVMYLPTSPIQSPMVTMDIKSRICPIELLSGPSRQTVIEARAAGRYEALEVLSQDGQSGFIPRVDRV